MVTLVVKMLGISSACLRSMSRSVGNVVVRLDAIFCWSAGWCGRVDGDRLVGGSRDKGCKVARLL
jgi:hypothetical protein